MTARSGESPAHGVRYVFRLAEHDDARAVYDVAVCTASGEGRARVRIEGVACALDGEATGVEPAQVTQLLALAKTIAKREADAPWPRRVERWRAPGVR